MRNPTQKQKKLLVSSMLLAASLASPLAWAGGGFQANKNHCTAGEFNLTTPIAGSSGFLFNTSAWSEGGVCLKLPIEALTKAASDEGVLTFRGVTKIAGVKHLPVAATGDLFDTVMLYEAYHSHLGCREAQWPIEWKGRIVNGTPEAPHKVQILATRIPGGDSNGSWVKQTKIMIEFVRSANGETSFHMRYEVRAPGQADADAIGAIRDYIDRVSAVASGQRLPGAVVDPACPYSSLYL